MKFLPLYISFDVIFREKSLIFFVEWGLFQWSAMAWRTKPSPFHVRQLRRLLDNRKTTCTIAMQIIFVKIKSFLPCYSATTLIVAMQKVYARDHIPERLIRWVEQWRFLSTLSKGWTFVRGKSIDESLQGSLIDSIIPSVASKRQHVMKIMFHLGIKRYVSGYQNSKFAGMSENVSHE